MEGKWLCIHSRSFSLLWIGLVLCTLPLPGLAQIGGKTATDGPFTLDDAEDLDLVADGVMRDWVPDYIWPGGNVLTTLTLTGSGLTPAPGQSPVGALKATIPETHTLGSFQGYISGGFGVPMPGVAGASSADYPGDITSFNFLNFKACYEPQLDGQAFQIVLETYPDPDFPNIHWATTPTQGTTFHDVWVDLWQPDQIDNAGALTLQDLLAQTRFLYFYAYAGPVPLLSELEYHVDDIRLVHAEVGGRSAAEGTVIIDDAEDLDLAADGVMRDWVSDYVWPQGYVLSTQTLSGSGLTPATGQSPTGALKATIPETHTSGSVEGYIDGGFGVPLPAIPGASTDDYPADLTSFTTLAFEACYEPDLSGQFFEVVLETSPGPTFPEIHWTFGPAQGTAFQTVEIDLRNPTSIQNDGGLSLSELLSQARFLYFFSSAGPVPIGSTLEWYMDDIRLEGVPAPSIAGEPVFTGGTSNTVSWIPVSQAQEYYLERDEEAAFGSPVNSGWFNGTEWIADGLVDGTTYYYRVKCRDGNLIESPWSNVVASTQDASPPVTSVDPLSDFQTSAVFDIPWSGSDAVSGLNTAALYYRRGTSGSFLQYGGTYTTSPIAFDSSATGGDGEYYFYTIGVDHVDHEEDPPAGPDAQTTVLTASTSFPVLAAEPEYTRGTTNLLSWSEVGDATGYYLEWSEDSSFTTPVGNSGWTTATSWVATALTDGTSYSYHVKSRNAALVESEWSNVVTSTQDASPPATSCGSLPAYTTSTLFNVPWSGSDGVSGLAAVQLYLRRGAGGTFAQYGGTYTASPIAVDSSLTGGDGDYYFYTVGTDNVGNQESIPATPDAQTTVVTSPPPAPTLLSEPTFTSGTTNEITWDSVPDATAYFLEWSLDSGFSVIAGNSGWVAATSHVVAGLADGETYHYRARCRNAVLLESAWSNAVTSTQDASVPQSHVIALPDVTSSVAFDIHCEASDLVSSVAIVYLYWRHDETGDFVRWPTAFADNAVTFDASAAAGDGLYEYYSVAEDSVGNAENPPAQADTQTVVSTSATRAMRWMFYR